MLDLESYWMILLNSLHVQWTPPPFCSKIIVVQLYIASQQTLAVAFFILTYTSFKACLFRLGQRR